MGFIRESKNKVLVLIFFYVVGFLASLSARAAFGQVTPSNSTTISIKGNGKVVETLIFNPSIKYAIFDLGVLKGNVTHPVTVSIEGDNSISAKLEVRSVKGAKKRRSRRARLTSLKAIGIQPIGKPFNVKFLTNKGKTSEILSSEVGDPNDLLSDLIPNGGELPPELQDLLGGQSIEDIIAGLFPGSTSGGGSSLLPTVGIAGAGLFRRDACSNNQYYGRLIVDLTKVSPEERAKGLTVKASIKLLKPSSSNRAVKKKSDVHPNVLILMELDAIFGSKVDAVVWKKGSYKIIGSMDGIEKIFPHFLFGPMANFDLSALHQTGKFTVERFNGDFSDAFAVCTDSTEQRREYNGYRH